MGEAIALVIAREKSSKILSNLIASVLYLHYRKRYGLVAFPLSLIYLFLVVLLLHMYIGIYVPICYICI